MQNTAVFVNTSNRQSEMEILNNIISTLKKYEILGINLTKVVQNLYPKLQNVAERN